MAVYIGVVIAIILQLIQGSEAYYSCSYYGNCWYSWWYLWFGIIVFIAIVVASICAACCRKNRQPPPMTTVMTVGGQPQPAYYANSTVQTNTGIHTQGVPVGYSYSPPQGQPGNQMYPPPGGYPPQGGYPEAKMMEPPAYTPLGAQPPPYPAGGFYDEKGQANNAFQQ